MHIIRKYILNVISASAGCIVALAVLEIFIQKAEIVSPSFADVDEKIGTVFRPDRKIVAFKEGFYMGGTNRYGYLGPAYPPLKNDRTLRIALLGDSYVEGFQLFDRYHFRTIMENKLRDTYGSETEVLNFGRSGFSLPDMYCYLSNYVDSFDPDIILFFVHATDLNTVNQSFGPRCILKDGKLEMSYGFNRSETFLYRGETDFFRGKMSLFSLFSNCRKLYDEGLTGQILLDKIYINYLTGDSKPDEALDIALTISDLDSAIIINLRGIREGQTGKEIAVVNMGMSAGQMNTIRRLGLDVIDPAPALRKLEQNGINPHYWKATNKIGHWNHPANKEVGEYLANELVKIISEANYRKYQ